jgi:hypothetical protein
MHPAHGALLLGAAFAVAVAPWLIRNTVLFGDPLYTANQHIGVARMYLPDFYGVQFRKVWWADPGAPLPTLGHVLHERGLWAILRTAWANLAAVRPESWEGLRWLLPLALIGVASSRRCAGFALYVTSSVVLTALVFPLLPRYLTPLHPAVAICAAVGAGRVWEWGSGLKRSGLKPTVSGEPGRGNHLALLRTTAPLAVALLAVVALDASGMRGLAGAIRYHAGDGCDHDYPVEEQTARRSADWARSELPRDARVMTQDCWRFTYYSGLASVNIPTDSPSAVAAVVDAYAVDHVVVDDGLYSDKVPFLDAYLLEHADEWQAIPTAPAGTRAYRRVGPSTPDVSSTPM